MNGNKMKNKIFQIAIFCIVISGCSSQVGNLSIVATKNIDFSHKKKVLVKSNVEGNDMKSMIIMFPTGQSQIDQAINNAVSSAGGDYMENVKITSKFWWIPYIYGRIGFIAIGDVYRLESDSAK